MNYFYLPLEEWTNQFVHDWLIPNFRGIFRLISDRIEVILDLFQTILLWIPPELFTLAVAILAWRTAGKRVALLVLMLRTVGIVIRAVTQSISIPVIRIMS